MTFGAGIALAADAAEPFAAPGDNGWNHGQGFQIVYHRGRPHKTLLRREGGDEAPEAPFQVVISAVSSPQTYLPLPSSMTTSKLKALPRIFSP